MAPPHFIVKIRRSRSARYDNFMAQLPSWWAEPRLAEGKQHVIATLDGSDRLVLTALTNDEVQRLRRA